MLKRVAWVALIALLTLVSVDRVVCADGCTDDGDEAAHTCVLCTSGLEAPVALPTLSPLGIIGRSIVPASHSVLSVPSPLLDHPPRFVSWIR